ncbi:MAG: 50S ribosomal protein L1 [Gammaproteobacteria bacterium RIFCSPHIGHO2_12_FULL_42_10]|nr:MAG: 50S ribosomal protein L1 [Gammaproteobacteria bacterium RIFCSPHIGHO2_12_FULL_42_10]
MTKLSKRQRKIGTMLTTGKRYLINEALVMLQSIPKVAFNESVDVAFNLGVDPRKSDQAVRGAVILPKGTGRSVRVAVLTTPSHVEAAKQAGADIVGLDDLAEQIKAGQIDFDMLLATPDAMRIVGQLGAILGPRGLMPNPKDGTVAIDIANAVKNAKIGQVRYRIDKAGIIHSPIGKVNFSVADLTDNLNAMIAALKKSKPATAKGVYFKKVTLSTTMGPGLTLDISQLEV